MANICTSNITSGFIDLATFDEIEKYMYGGPDATAYFVRETRKSTWFTQVPVILTKASGSAGFGNDWSAQISRAGDYLLQTWLRVGIDPVQLASSVVNLNYATMYPSCIAQLGSLQYNVSSCKPTIRWTNNLMHNLVKECAITFNDLVAARFDSSHLDFWAAFTVPAGKRNGYLNMIGNNTNFTQPVGPGGRLLGGNLNLPLPFFYGRDSGVALPTAALPYNDMRINICFRSWEELLILQWSDIGCAPITTSNCTVKPDYLHHHPMIRQNDCNVWANYAIVSNDERKRMACAPRDILIEQVQSAPWQDFKAVATNPFNYDIRFSHAIKVLFFAARNITARQILSNYTTVEPIVASIAGKWGEDQAYYTVYNPSIRADPILATSLVYENTARLYQMGSDYFSLVNPYFNAPNIPNETGYHSYSYSLDFICLDPMGSTNYGKLTNVSIQPTPSAAAVLASAPAYTTPVEHHGGVAYPGNIPGPSPPTAGYSTGQNYQFIVTAVNNNIIRISGGALGFPVL